MTDSESTATSMDSPIPLERWINWASEHPLKAISPLLVLAVVPFAYSPLLQPWFREGDWRILNPNEVGDTFGFLNAVMSSLAVLGVLATYRLQRKELQEQLKESRKSAEAQKEMVNLQLTQSYISALTTAINHYESERRAPETGSIRMFDEPSVREFATTLSRMIRRWEGCVKEIAGSQPMELFVYLPRLANNCYQIYEFLLSNDIDNAKKISAETYHDIQWWIPRLKSIDQNIAELVGGEVLGMVGVIAISDGLDSETVKRIIDGLQDLTVRISRIDPRKYSDGVYRSV